MGMSEPVIRRVDESDLEIFFEMQRDPESVAMAEVPARDLDAHIAHWKKILADPLVETRTIELEGEIVGNLVSWVAEDERYVGYWIAREHWGRGIASAAFPMFLDELDDPVLYATTALGNDRSARILEKNGFVFDKTEANLNHWILRRG